MKQKKNKTRRVRPEYFDYSLLACVIILIFFGLVMLYSASAYEAANDAGVKYDGMYYFRHQLQSDIIAFILCQIVIFFDYHMTLKLSPFFYLLSLLLMAMVKFTPMGVEAYGAKRWLSLGPVSFQPSELAKVAIIIFLPYLMMMMGRNLHTRRGIVTLIVVSVLPALEAYVFTENLSTAVIIALIALVMIFLASRKTKPFVKLLIVAAASIVLFLVYVNVNLTNSSDFRMRRVLSWLQPENNMNTGGYQVLQGLYAIGSGGIFGKGLGNSTQKLATIPEAQNDMIFAIICEELGLFGALLVLILFAYLLYRIIVIAMNAPDLSGTLIAAGVFTHVALQVTLNICVVLNVIPTTGVTLPFISYGGTSVLFLMVEMGLVLNISKNIRFSGDVAGNGVRSYHENKPEVKNA